MTNSAEAMPSNKIKSIFMQVFVTFPSVSFRAMKKFIQTNTSQTFTSSKCQCCVPIDVCDCPKKGLRRSSNICLWDRQHYDYKNNQHENLKKRKNHLFSLLFFKNRIKFISKKTIGSRLTQFIDQCYSPCCRALGFSKLNAKMLHENHLSNC